MTNENDSTLSLLIIGIWSKPLKHKIMSKLTNTDQEVYVAPSVETINLQNENFLCSSPNEGVGEEEGGGGFA